MDIVVHPRTRSAIAKYLQAPAQVLAVVGSSENGTAVIAKEIAAKILNIKSEKLDDSHRIIRISIEDGKREIAIGSIRGLIVRLHTKAPGEDEIKRIVLIDDAELLSLEAQNALLKTLEQPNQDTIFIFTVGSQSGVLPTLMSRAVKLAVHPVRLSDALKHYSVASDSTVKLAWNTSEGAGALLHDLLLGDAGSELRISIESAKSFLAADKYHRLIRIDELASDKAKLTSFMTGLNRILKVLHHGQIRKGNQRLSARILNSRKVVIAAQDALNSNAAAKLTLLNLVESLEV